jgi:hypothetical protein
MGEQDDLGQRLSAFARALPMLCVELQGDARIDAAHRLYEQLLCATRREHLDQAHDVMSALMHRHRLIR